MVKMLHFQLLIAALGLLVPFVIPRIKGLLLITGVRRDWTPKNTETCRPMHPDQLIGCEDLHLHVDGADRILFTACAADMQDRIDWFPAMGHVSKPKSGIRDRIFAWDLVSDKLTELTSAWDGDFVSHGIDVVKTGRAKEVAIYAINHLVSGSVVEKFIHTVGSKEIEHVMTFDDQQVVFTPNDLYVVDESDDLFYITNDHAYKTGKMRELETILQLPTTHLAMHSNAQSGYRIVASGLECVNGLSGDRKGTMYLNHVNARMSVYNYQQNGDLELTHSFRVNHGIDNPSFNGETNELIVSGFPSALELFDFAKRPSELATTSVVTRIKVDDLRTETGFAQPALDEFFFDAGSGVMNMSTTAVVDVKGDAWYMGSAFGFGVVKCTGYSKTY